ncbi:hypothetical protein PS662_03963 [Pseudomonas fluorescens]|uniref:Uncharacterized protein n=1 Tax=Pseudomonas fluorescens TaxID=294 RepID=A0A5E6V7K1_PSEFL|nr:hypothetical protein [Pseudomonas fluorescens]VVN13248.1 hypothetical protein PS662_03963 [Pseudomonas fluorescens]
MEQEIDVAFIKRDFSVEPESASVLDDNLMAFFPGLSRQDKHYIKNSLRWAEHQADLRYSRKLDPAQWFEHLSGRLWSVGWSLEHAPVQVVQSNYSGSLVESWAKALSTQVSRARLQKIKDTFVALEHDRSALDLFAERAQQSGDFRFLPAEYNRAKELEIVVTNVRLLSTNWSSAFLFWEVEHPASQLDIRVRRFSARPREMDKYRDMLAEAVRDMRFSELELKV